MAADTPRVRLGILGVVVVALMSTLFARLWYLQVLDAPDYQVAAELVQVREIRTEAARGRILDRNGRVIVDNRISIAVLVDPGALGDDDERLVTLTTLAEMLSRSGQRVKVSELEQRLDDKTFSAVEPRPLAVDIDEELAVLLGERTDELPGIRIERRTARVYPYGQVASHLLGYVGRISPDELAAKQEEPVVAAKPYAGRDVIGKSGVERIFENDLRGTPGLQRVEVDAHEIPLRTLSAVAPRPGYDIQLSIDIDVQAAAEESLAQQVRGLRAPGGAVVVLDPQDGSVLALASNPTFDPTAFVNGISSEDFAAMQAAAKEPLLNRALQSGYPPGSTFKLITGFAGLQSGMIGANSSYPDAGVYTLQGCEGRACQFSNAGGAVFGTVGVQRAMTVSSNVFFAWLGERFWLERTRYGYAIADTARSFGMGAATGVQLPSETRGHIPDPDSKRARHEENPTAFPEPGWFTGDNVNSALGQGDVLASPIQLANAYATFGNGGTLHAPNLVWRVLEPTSEGLVVVRELAPRVVRQVEMAEATRIPIEAGLRGVTSDPSGTAYRVFQGFDLNSFPIAAKTGTAEVRGKEDNAVFAAYGPIGAPRFALSVVVEEGGFGSVGAGPIARYLFDRLSGQVPLQQARSLRPVIVLDVPTDGPVSQSSEGEPSTTSTTGPTTTAPASTSSIPGGAP